MINVRVSRKLVICRCASRLGLVTDNGLFHVKNVVEKKLNNKTQNEREYGLVGALSGIEGNEIRLCPGCSRTICVMSLETNRNCSTLEVPAYAVANINVNTFDSEAEPTAAICHCGFIVGEFIDDNNKVVLDMD